MEKYLIVNADDFGASTGVNQRILECHTRGVVTSASLMVTGRAVGKAVSMSHDHIQNWPSDCTGTSGGKTNGSSTSTTSRQSTTNFMNSSTVSIACSEGCPPTSTPTVTRTGEG